MGLPAADTRRVVRKRSETPFPVRQEKFSASGGESGPLPAKSSTPKTQQQKLRKAQARADKLQAELNKSSSSSQPVPDQPKPKKQKQPKQTVSTSKISGQLNGLQREAVTNAGAFVDDLIDPAAKAVRCPLNTIPTAVSRCKLNYELPSGTGYDTTGQFMTVVTPDPETPMYVTHGAADNYVAGACPDLSGSAFVDMPPGTDNTYWVGFLQAGTSRIIAPAREDARGVPAYYRCTIAGATAIVGFQVKNPSHFIIRLYHRTGLNWTAAADIQVRPGTYAYTSSLPINADAFYVEIVRNPLGVNRNSASTEIDVAVIPQAATTMSFGNHLEYLRALATPSVSDYKIQRAKALGMRIMWSFRDSKIYAKGNIVAAQFPPGTFHSMFPGSRVFDQVMNSKMKSIYNGEVTEGAVGIFTPPSMSSLSMNAPTQTIGNSGYMVIWTDAQGNGASAAAQLQLWYTIEYTSFSLQAELARPDYSTSAQLEGALALMARMPLFGENPQHELIDRAWQWFKKHALTVMKNPDTYRTLGAITGAAVAML